MTGRAPADLINAKPTFQGSRDGFNAKAFCRAMDGKGRALVVIHVKHRGVLCSFGGFSAAGFKDYGGGSYGSNTDPQTFLFTLTNPHGIRPTAYHVTEPDYATFCCASAGYMFSFGRGNDIFLVNECHVDRDSHTRYFPTSFADTTGKGPATFTGEGKGDWRVADVWAFVI